MAHYEVTKSLPEPKPLFSEIFRSKNLRVTLTLGYFPYTTDENIYDFKIPTAIGWTDNICRIVTKDDESDPRAIIFFIQWLDNRKHVKPKEFMEHCEDRAPQIIEWIMFNELALFAAMMK